MVILSSLLFLVLGWLLGLFSPLIVDWLRRGRDRKEMKKAIMAELAELQLRTAATFHLLAMRHGTVDKAVIDWLLAIFERYPGGRVTQRTVTGLKELAKLSNEQINTLVLSGQDSKAKTLRKLELPFLDSKIGYISSFPTEFQFQILELRTDIGLYNEMVNDARQHLEWTFNPTSMNANKDAILGNLEQIYRHIERASRDILERVDKIIAT